MPGLPTLPPLFKTLYSVYHICIKYIVCSVYRIDVMKKIGKVGNPGISMLNHLS